MKAAIYARYSSDNQREESIDAQVRAIREYCGRNGIRIVRTYTDEARSATTADRPGFLQMIQDSNLSLFDVVVVHKLDRFSRDRYDSAFYKRQLKMNGIKLLSVLENLDDSPESIILESVLEGMAEYYSANLAREVMKGMKETAMQCKHTGGKPPLGYDVAEDKTYIINEHEAEAVRLIFEMYAAGKGYNQIIDELNKAGYKTKIDNKFGKNSIHDILKNEKYKGVYIFNRSARKANGKRNHHSSKPVSEIIRIEDGMPAIISKELFERVKNRMGENKKRPGAGKSREIYKLSGIIYCGKCGSAMVGNRRYAGRNRTKYLSYECSARKRKKTCGMKSIGAEYIENLVIEELESRVFTPEAVDMLANKIYEYAKNQNSEIKEDIKHFGKELDAVQKEIDNIVSAVARGMFHISFKEKMDHLELRKEELNRKLNEARLQVEINSPTVEMIKKYIAKDAGITNKSPEEQKRIIQAYVQKVIVYDDYLDGGGGGSRTHVRRYITKSFSECSHWFSIPSTLLPMTGLRLQ